jgi:MFS transporter, putative metabolite:H+ symporter
MTHADPAAVAARMERIPNTRYTWVIVLLVAGALIVEALDIGSLGTILPIVKKVMDLRPSDVGLLAASSALGIVIGMIPAGYLADRYGRKPLLIGGMIWFASGTMIAALSPNFTVLLIVRSVSGLGMAATFIMPYSIVSEFVSRTSRGAFSGLLESALGLGYLLPPILGLIIVPLFAPEVAWRVFLVLAGLPLVYVWVIWWFLPESPRWLSRVGRHDEAERVVSMLERRAEQALGRPLPPPRVDARIAEALISAPPDWRTLAAVWRPPFTARTVAMIFGAAGISSMFYLGVNYIPSLFVERHIALSNAFVFTLVITAAQIPGKLLNGIVGEYIGRKWVYVIYTLVAASAAYFFGQSTTPAATVAWGALMWFSAPGSAPSYKIWYAEQYPTPMRATGQSTVESIGGRLLGGVIWTSIFPVMVASCGIATTMSIVAGMALGALVIVTCFAPETYRWSVEELETQERRQPVALVPSAAATSLRHPP